MTHPPSSSNADELRTASVLLARAEAGDHRALDAMVSLLYDELREIAHRHRLRWRGDETLGTTALVNEAYLRLAEPAARTYAGRPHLLAVASRAMRQILMDYARSKGRAKRGGHAAHVSLDHVDDVLGQIGSLSAMEEDGILALSESLGRLEAHSERHARIVECRFFGGLSIDETAKALDIAPATVKRSWSVARAWLKRDLEESHRPVGGSA